MALALRLCLVLDDPLIKGRTMIQSLERVCRFFLFFSLSAFVLVACDGAPDKQAATKKAKQCASVEAAPQVLEAGHFIMGARPA